MMHLDRNVRVKGLDASHGLQSVKLANFVSCFITVDSFAVTTKDHQYWSWLWLERG
jgi:hypothetical protein